MASGPLFLVVTLLGNSLEPFRRFFRSRQTPHSQHIKPSTFLSFPPFRLFCFQLLLPSFPHSSTKPFSRPASPSIHRRSHVASRDFLRPLSSSPPVPNASLILAHPRPSDARPCPSASQHLLIFPSSYSHTHM